MLRQTDGPQAAHRAYTILLAIAMIVGLSVLAPTAAHASGCSDSWTNAAGGSWFTGTNWSTGAPPKSEEEACIVLPGTYTVTMYQSTSTVTVQSLAIGGESGTQTLSVGSTCSLNAVLTTTTTTGIQIAPQGAITLTNGDGCGDSVAVASPINNLGTITSEPANGGARKIEGSVTNKGTLAFNASTSYAGASSLLTNEGALNVAEGKQLSASGGASLTNGTGGKIAGTGSGNVLITGGTLTEGQGTTSGTQPAIVDDGTLAYSAGGGASLIALRGTSSLSGTSSLGQSLSLQSTCSENTVVTAASGFTNGGTTYLTNGDGCGDSVTLNVSGTGLSSSGMIVSEPAHGGSRQITGSLTNTGTLAFNVSTSYSGTGALLTNEGTLDVAEGKTLTVAAKSALTNGAGGSIAATGNGDVLAASGSTFTEGAGTTSGSEPVIADDAALNYTGAGASKISLHGTSALSGSLAAGQSLAIQSTCSENALATAAASFTNAGSITLTNGDGCGNSATLATTTGTLTNSGKLTTEVDHGGARAIEGNLTNTGTLAIGANTSYDGKGASLQNEGAIEVTETKQLTVSNSGSLTNASGGSIGVGTGADVLMSSGTTFNEGTGTTAGGKPVIVDDGTLNYTGAGASQIIIRGSSALTGNLGSEQSLAIQSTCSENAVVTAGASFTNAGSITLTNGDGCGDSATLATTAGTLTNSGKLFTQPANGGSRTLQGNLTNTGTMTINANTGYPTSGATLNNEGTISILSGVTFSVPGSAAATVTNGSKGLIEGIGSGALVQTGGKFNWGLGNSTGHEPVILDDLTLDFTEHGAGKVALRGSSTIVGTVRSGETLVLESTCSENGVATTSGVGLTNNGTLELTNGDGCGNSVTLNAKGGTLTSSGIVNVDFPAGGSRTIEGNVLSTGILTVAPRATLHVSGTYTQTSTARFKPYIASASEYGSLSATGAVTLNGLLVVHQVLPFKATLGQTYPIVTGASLSGSFASESEDQVYYTGIYYKPTYSATAATLVVSQATQVRSPHSGAPGSVISISGTGYLPNDTITVTFTDHAGAKTVFPTVTTNSSGEFSTEITVPAKAAPGTATTLVTSALTGVHISLGFSVT